eukprot:5488534-Pyramimonas_sp.AAC.1
MITAIILARRASRRHSGPGKSCAVSISQMTTNSIRTKCNMVEAFHNLPGMMALTISRRTDENQGHQDALQETDEKHNCWQREKTHVFHNAKGAPA